MDLLHKYFFYSYKQGQINLALSNRVNFSELYQIEKKRKGVKKIEFNPTISLCLIEDSEDSATQTCSQMSDSQMFFFTCSSGKEADLLRNKTLLSN